MTTRPRNLLLLVADEHRRDAAGFMGHPLRPTPCLDRLAARGTVFARGYTPAPIRVPARAALATGLPTHRTGHWDSAAPWTGTPRGWMHALRDAGLHTATFGKLHYKAGCDHGAVEEVAPMHVVGAGWTIGLIRDGTASYDAAAEMAEEVGSGETETTAYDRAVTRAAMVWLGHGARKRSPWAAMVSLVTPHYPLVAPKPWFDAVDPELIPGAIAPRAWPDHPELRRVRGFFDHDPHFDDPGFVAARRSYFGLVSFMDDCMGQVLGALEDSGQRDETLVLYISDHGEMLGDHGYWGKSVMYEASAGVPMVMAGPGVAPRRCETPVTLLDVATTALATFGLESDGLPGGDLWAIARVTDDAGRAAFSEYHDGGSTTGAFMVRWDRWKYVHYSGERAQLFDLEMDPQEMKDLGADPDFEAIRAEGLDRLSAICDPDAVNAAAHADQAQRLAAMGGKEAALQTAFSHTPIPGVKG